MSKQTYNSIKKGKKNDFDNEYQKFKSFCRMAGTVYDDSQPSCVMHNNNCKCNRCYVHQKNYNDIRLFQEIMDVRPQQPSVTTNIPQDPTIPNYVIISEYNIHGKVESYKTQALSSQDKQDIQHNRRTLEEVCESYMTLCDQAWHLFYKNKKKIEN